MSVTLQQFCVQCIKEPMPDSKLDDFFNGNKQKLIQMVSPHKQTYV